MAYRCVTYSIASAGTHVVNTARSIPWYNESMAFKHTTAANPTTYLRMLLLTLVAAFIALRVPYVGEDALDFVSPRIINLGILFSITVGFLMYKSLNRRSDLDNYIALELNKIRRIYHLSRHVAKTASGSDGWLAAVTGGIREYLGLFRTFSFHEYRMGNPLFRSVTYAVYALPSAVKKYNSDLYQALLTATGEATEAREFIRAKKDDRVSLFSWIIVALISLIFAVLVIAATPYVFVLRAVGALVILCLFLVLQLIFEHDRANSLRDHVWAQRYVDDLVSLDHADNMK
jgi:hypothetical protein